MILFFSFESEVDRDVERRGPQYVSLRTSFFALGILVLIISIFLAIVMPGCLARKRLFITQANLKALASGFQAYADSNDEGLPPAFEAADGKPVVSNGVPDTWASRIIDYVDPAVMNNPSSSSEWDSRVADPKTAKPVSLSYGANAALLSPPLRTTQIANPGELVLLAETIGGGRQNSFDPVPLEVPELRDGFLIGFDNTNGRPNSASTRVTRLAFISEVKNPKLSDMRSLHPDHGLAAITVEGRILALQAEDQMLGTQQRRWVPK